MKLRVKDNSVRLRLTKPDMDLFEKNGYLEEKTGFPGNTFTYAIQKLFDGKNLDASFTDQKLTVYVPHKTQEEWFQTDVVGFSHLLEFGENQQLFLLIEKDFKCTDGEGEEDQSEYYDHPVKNC